MTSGRKIQANRANARLSSGAKTPRGRASSAKNAFRHGLSVSIQLDPALSDEAKLFVDQIAGPTAGAQLQDLARRIVEAQMDLRRVRSARHHLCNGLDGTATSDPNLMARTLMSDKVTQLLALERYETRALSRRKFAIRAFDALQARTQNEVMKTL